MFQSEKPKLKRKPYLETEADVKRAYRDFHGRLLLILLIPACILSAIFMLLTILINNVYNSDNHVNYFDECSISEGSYTVRVSSETTLITKTSYWSVEDYNWQEILTVEHDYRHAVADCEAVIFYGDSVIVYEGQYVGILDAHNQVENWHFSACDTIETVTIVASSLNIVCENSREFSINDTIVWGN